MTVGDLANECGLSKYAAIQIARSRIPGFARIHKGEAYGLTKTDVAKLRPLFIAARHAPRPTAELAEIPAPEIKPEEAPVVDKFEGMTIRDIAEICEASESTIRNWIASANSADISSKTAEARETSKPARFTLPEVLEIIRAGGKNTLADLLEANAAEKKAVESRKSQRMTNVAKLPAGIQLHELRMIYGNAAAKRLDYLIGYEAGMSLPEEGKAPPAIAEAAFQKLGKLFDKGAQR